MKVIATLLTFLILEMPLSIANTYIFSDNNYNTISIYVNASTKPNEGDKILETYARLVRIITLHKYSQIEVTDFKPVKGKTTSVSLEQQGSSIHVTITGAKKGYKKFEISTPREIVLEITTILFGQKV